MPSNHEGGQSRVALQRKAWALRQRGYSQRRIAETLDLSQATVCRWMTRIAARQEADQVAQYKAAQAAVLEHMIDEALSAWEASKKPRKRVSEKTDKLPDVTEKDGTVTPGPELKKVKLVEVVERDGDPAHIDRAMAASDRLRKLLGLDAAPARKGRRGDEEEGSAGSFAEMVRRLKQNAENHERDEAEDDPERDTDDHG